MTTLKMLACPTVYDVKSRADLHSWPRLLSSDNPKAEKAQAYGWHNAIHYAAPARLAQAGNLCPHASPACIALCLGWESGQAGMAKPGTLNSVRASRIIKSRLFQHDRAAYVERLAFEIEREQRRANKAGLKLCIRPNGSTDIPWESIKAGPYRNLMDRFPAVQFTDYTKSKKRALAHAAGKLPSNYHLTFSRTEDNDRDCVDVLAAGGTVAAVFETLPETWHGYPVIDGDQHDLRHLDGRGVVVGLLPKGRLAKRDTTGFVTRSAA